MLAARRAATQDLLREGVLTEGWRLNPGSDTVAAEVGAAMYTGAMAELAQQWLAGQLGTPGVPHIPLPAPAPAPGPSQPRFQAALK